MNAPTTRVVAAVANPMANAQLPPRVSGKTRRRWVWLLLAVPLLLLSGVAVLAALGGSCLFLSSETRGLRDAIQRAAAVACVTQVEVNVRPAVLSLLRPALNLLDLDPVAREACRAIRAAEVGVYKLGCAPEAIDRAATLASIEAFMTRRGWTRVVGVLDPDSVVAVYTPRNTQWPSNFKFKVVVLENQELVIVSVRGDLEPLVEAALAKADLRGKRLRRVFQVSETP